ncbi:oxygenase MpaB family protein [Nocardioides sp. R-C-SC26]|uniref:oxygenase MpaB family protein n=1 Tax=Nocardioides sp. R-C-SC26 TaxID=2870414 RepID=UPI001E5AACBE|nr:oxygenase MpaB family protein [Nocardioides sp. R-C-SC26]
MPRLPLIGSRARLAERYEPHADYGFFGPDSVTWKVWGHPTSYILGFARSVTIEHFDPNLAAAVVQSGGVKYRPHTRYGRTMRYFGMVAFGATEPTAKAADVLVKVHSKAIGHDPVTGGEYDANRPSSQLWIHMTAWHSILLCYETFGPGRLSAEEETQFWAECARAAELQTIDPATVPRSREEVRAYFEEWRPHLAASEAAQDMIDFILGLKVALPPDLPALQSLAFTPVTALMRRAIISTYPRYMRQMAGLSQGPIVDALVRPPTKLLHQVLASNLHLRLALMHLLAPQAVDVAAPAILGMPPLNPITMTPREAQARYGFEVPDHAHPDLRAKQRRRVFDDGVAPSDEGLVESQQHIGPLAPRETASA